MIRLLQKDTNVDSANSLWQAAARILGLSGSYLNDPLQLSYMTRNRDTCGTHGDDLRSDEGEGS